MERRHWIALLAGVLLALLVGLGLGLFSGGTSGTIGEVGEVGEDRAAPSAETSTDPVSELPWIAEEDLPPEPRETLALIEDGGPYPHDQDGQTFFNREDLLPDAPEGYYREYTVETPGEEDRGPRRIVTGDEGEYYWTSDHYASFERIAR